MKISKVTGVLVLILATTVAVFQNCAKGKFVDPDTVHSAFATGLCRHCSDESGHGITCRPDQNAVFASCVYETCNPGFQLQTQNHQCVPVACTAGSIANCEIAHGEGRMVCNEGASGYGACVAISCEAGFQLAGNQCDAIPAPACTAGAHRDCSNETTIGIETCNDDGSGFGACVLGDCKTGFHKDDADQCVANLCEPNHITPCTVGAGSGFQECNSIGSAYGACELNGCQSGYQLQNGVCVVQVCVPNQQYDCAFHNGSGVKTCNADGMDYGACVLLGCNHGYGVVNGQCAENVCEPNKASACQGESGTGVMYCYENGRGHGNCNLTSCDPGFKLKNGQCVIEDSCDAGETLACTGQNGTGLRTCNVNANRFGPCVLNQCNAGYELVEQSESKACRKSK
jgi:hypothetical protein